MEPYKVELDPSAAESLKKLPEAGRIAVLKYLHVVAAQAEGQSPELPAQRMAEVATFMVRYLVDRKARCVRVISPLV